MNTSADSCKPPEESIVKRPPDRSMESGSRRAEAGALRFASMLFLSCTASFLGCSRQGEEFQRKLDLQDARILYLENKLAALEKDRFRKAEQAPGASELKLAQGVADMQATMHESREANRRAIEGFRRQLAEKERRIMALETQIRASAQSIIKPTAPLEEPGLFSTALPALAADIATAEPAAPDISDPFPLKVYEIQGERIITGSHKSPRYVETDETYRDEFNRLRKVIKTEEVEVNEYDFHVKFSVDNLAATPTELSYRAGAATAHMTLSGKGSQTNLTVRSAKGAPLTVMTGGFKKTFPVKYLPSQN